MSWFFQICTEILFQIFALDWLEDLGLPHPPIWENVLQCLNPFMGARQSMLDKTR